ncbi:YqaJ viral recombinase family protein [Kitasatospora sp. NPDC018058]|uniref:YqaJ viral recombinase family protein n=1 Tax=Kitasatospora sp. NPDC018058 TaxID=3364025 RepID=UPI0037C19576
MRATPTPTGVLLGRLQPGTSEWEAARTGPVITATRIAAVMGLSPWESRLSLYHRLRGEAPDTFTATSEMEWGNRHEPTVAEKWQEDHPNHMVLTTGTWRHRDRPWQRCTPDRLITPLVLDEKWTVADTEVLEIKTSPVAEGWGEDGDPLGIPVYYRCQVMWQLDTLGLTRATVAVLIAGHDYRTYPIKYDADEADLLRTKARLFLDDVEDGYRPDIDGHSATYQTIRHLPDGMRDVDVEIEAELRDRYFAAIDAHAAAETELTECRSRILDRIGDGRRARTAGRLVATRTVRDGHTHSLQPARDRSTA